MRNSLGTKLVLPRVTRGFSFLYCWSLFLLLPTTGMGQIVKYHFKDGEVLDYEMIESRRVASTVYLDENQKITKYRFTVNRTTNRETWYLSMKTIGIYSNYRQEIGRDIITARYSSTYINDPYSFNLLSQIEINHPVTFLINDYGEILEVIGVDLIFNTIIQKIKELPELRRILSYDKLKVRYSPMYYKTLFRFFFPLLENQSSDNIVFASGGRNINMARSWQRVVPKKDSIGLFYDFRISYQFRSNGGYYGLPKDTSLSGYGKLDPATGCPVHFEYVGYPLEDIAEEVILKNGSILYNKGNLNHIRINYMQRSGDLDRPITIVGQFYNQGNRYVSVCIPGNTISKKRIPVDINPDGTFFFQTTLDASSGLINMLYMEKETRTDMLHEYDNQIRAFVKPGDTIRFTMDFKNRKTLNFSGPTATDQEFLNSWYANFTNIVPPTLSITIIKEGLLSLNQQMPGLSQSFAVYILNEMNFALLSAKLQELRLWHPEKSPLNPMDSLIHFLPFLGLPEGKSSDCYRQFIQDYVATYLKISSIAKVKYYQDRQVLFNLGNTLLDGWDLYWYLAMLTETSLIDFPESAYEDLYSRYSMLFPGTEYQNELSTHNDKIRSGFLGNEVPFFRIHDQEGKKLTTRDFTGKLWCIVNTSDSKLFNRSVLNFADSLMIQYPTYFRYVICTRTPDTAYLANIIKQFRGKSVSIITNQPENQEFFAYLDKLPRRLIAVDQDNRIAAHAYISNGSMERLSTWPDLTTAKSSTINLTTFWYSLAGAFVLTIIIVLTIRIRAKRKENRLNLKRKMAQLEVDAVRSRMNPHFLFNALSSIQNLVNRHQIEEANLYLARFGELVRTILSQSSKPAIGLNEEIDMIRNYLQLEQLRFPFSIDIQIDSHLDLFAIEVPPLLIQPHVENAVMHGVSALGAAGRITVNFRSEENQLICEVTDNGPGYHPAENHQTGGLGQGWKLTRQRIQLLKEQLGQEVSAEVVNLAGSGGAGADSSGTTVIFRLPIQKTAP